MKKYHVRYVSSLWSNSLDVFCEKVENKLNNYKLDGYEIVSVSFGYNFWRLPVAFITICK